MLIWTSDIKVTKHMMSFLYMHGIIWSKSCDKGMTWNGFHRLNILNILGRM